ncbi:MAG: glycosyltransferase [Chitinispirillia bacterium]|nr:glycosyltransferase [Chitinispirillia bacterium]MCL2240987.1 glycosyltransferase [Chitinispirillia bacterium]
MTPGLSIITVNFNNKDGFIKTADSVIAQTWGDYEWIIIDGGSTDGSAEVIREYAEKSGKVAFWCSERDGGIYEGMNKGIAAASGRYLYFLNSGDYLREPASLEGIFAFDFDEDIVFGDMMLEGDDGGYVIWRYKNRLHPSDLLYGFLPHQNMFIKARLFGGGGYRTDLRLVSDWAHYTAAICRGNASYRHIHTVLAVNQRGGVSGSAGHWYIQKAERRMAVREIFTPLQRFCYIFTVASLRNKIYKVSLRLKKLSEKLNRRGAGE